jgi:hypothetical protein
MANAVQCCGKITNVSEVDTRRQNPETPRRETSQPRKRQNLPQVTGCHDNVSGYNTEPFE